MLYILDTNICIYIIKKKPKNVIDILEKKKISSIGISTITLSELEYGVEKSQASEKNRLALVEFCVPIEIYPYDDEAAKTYGEIRTYLERMGNPIGSLDMLIAAHAKSLGHILVTNNEREFKKVPGLKTENWAR
ncbi:MAG: type II toxin-antitoxin system VapC family toxin [bacterium]